VQSLTRLRGEALATALELDVRAAKKKRSVRKEISIEANLAKTAILFKNKGGLAP